MFMNLIWGVVALIFGLGLFFNNIPIAEQRTSARRFGLAALLVAAVLIVSSFVRIVPAGTVGVVDLFGKVSEAERKAGLNLVNPFAKLEIMNVKTEEIKETMTVPSKEGLSVQLELSILYRLDPEVAGDVYRKVGLNYRNIAIVPAFRSVARGSTVNYEAKALYTSEREEISRGIFQELEGMLKERGVVLEKVLLRSITLPQTIAGAIEQKLKAEQEAEQMKFVLDKERKEAERKIIEAEGIGKAQAIINKTLTSQYLQHEAIQAQRLMASSPNHTTVYIPAGDNGIPLVRVAEGSALK